MDSSDLLLSHRLVCGPPSLLRPYSACPFRQVSSGFVDPRHVHLLSILRHFHHEGYPTLTTFLQLWLEAARPRPSACSPCPLPAADSRALVVRREYQHKDEKS